MYCHMRASQQLREEPRQPVPLWVPLPMVPARTPSLLPMRTGFGSPFATGCSSAGKRVPGAWAWPQYTLRVV